MEYNLITTKTIKVDNTLLMSIEDFKIELKLNDNEIYVVDSDTILYLLDAKVKDNRIQAEVYLIGGYFDKDIRDTIFSFNLKRFYKIEQ